MGTDEGESKDAGLRRMIKMTHSNKAILVGMLFCTLKHGVAFAVDQDAELHTEGISEVYLRCVVSIEQKQNGVPDPVPIGTGFVLESPNNHILLITARHVVKEATGGIRRGLVYRIKTKNGKMVVMNDSELDGRLKNWFVSDKPSEDVACRFITRRDDDGYIGLKYRYLLDREHVRPGARVVVPSFPLGLRSAENPNPIVRNGIVARSDSDGLMIDSFAHPGSSGSPVVYVPTMRLTDIDLKNDKVLSEDRLIGLVVRARTEYEVMKSQTSGREIKFVENMGLSDVVPADAIRRLVSSTEVKSLDESLPTQLKDKASETNDKEVPEGGVRAEAPVDDKSGSKQQKP